MDSKFCRILIGVGTGHLFEIVSNSTHETLAFAESRDEADKTMDNIEACPKKGNPYANDRGEATGRLGKAWQHGYDGRERKATWSPGSAVHDAFLIGRLARGDDERGWIEAKEKLAAAQA